MTATDLDRRPPERGLMGWLRRERWRLAMAVVPVFGAMILGSIATTPNIPTWYVFIQKPSFTPPNWVFGPAWTILFTMMAIAIWRILRLPEGTPGRARAVTLFYVQLALNAGWSWAFFWAQSPLAGLIVIIIFLVTIALTLVSFRRLDRIAGWLFVPYLAWVSYATLLNFAIWRLN